MKKKEEEARTREGQRNARSAKPRIRQISNAN